MDEKTLKVLEYNKIIKKLVGFTVSQLGKEKAENLLPVHNVDIVKEMLRETDEGIHYMLKRGNPPLGGIRDVRGGLKRVRMGAILNPAELLDIGDVLRLCRQLRAHAFENVKIEDEKSGVLDFINNLKPNRKLEDKINQSILNKEEISDNASAALRNIRRQIKEQQESIKDKLNSIIRSARYQKYIQDSLITIRGDRYVVPVKQEYRGEVPGLIHDSSASGATLFIEPIAVVEANNYIKQLKIKEQTEIEKILGELTNNVSEFSTCLESNVSILGELDFIFAKAKLGFYYKCILPKINKEGYINIKKGRHPLLDPESVVPIDFWVGKDFSSLIVTGPNTGGKTVTLKTVGLLTLMTLAGLHIPAGDNTEISVFNNVFADIGDEQSIEQSLSTFSSHMTNIVKILEKADNKSLVLLDELGAGTDPTEGAALAMSILEYLHGKGAITVATTHYSELKIYAMVSSHTENASCEFDIKTLKPTFKLLIGIPGKSNAFAISKRLGLRDGVLERAKEFLTQEDIKFEDLMLSMEKDRKETEKERELAEVYRWELEKLRDELSEERKKMENKREEIIRNAKEESRRILVDTKKETESIIKELKRIEKEKEAAEKHKVIEGIRTSIDDKINKLDESLIEPLMPRNEWVEPPKNLKAGDSVLIINLNQKGIVIEPPGNNQEAIVQVGIMKINVHISNLKIIDEQKIQIAKTGAGKIGKEKARSISTELDLRGLIIDEAVVNTDKYLDDAKMAGLKSIALIHGKGTGALRAGIHQHLRGHPHVKSYRLGKFGEGGAGVTMVELK